MDTIVQVLAKYSHEVRQSQSGVRSGYRSKTASTNTAMAPKKRMTADSEMAPEPEPHNDALRESMIAERCAIVERCVLAEREVGSG